MTPAPLLGYAAALASWAVVHTAWQASLGAALVLSARRALLSRPHARFALAFVASLTLVVVFPLDAVLTHLALLSDAGRAAPFPFAPVFLDAVVPSAFLDARAHFPALVGAAWIAGVAVVCVRYAIGCVGLARIGAGSSAASSELSAHVARLAARLGLSRAPRVRVTAAVHSPFVTGFGAPVLYLPRVQLPHDELEATLLHELAHLRRRDLRAVPLFCAIRAIFWWHPGIHWIVAQAGEAREDACDAVAVEHSANPLALVRALVRFAELRTASPASLGMSDGSLTRRARRLTRSADDGLRRQPSSRQNSFLSSPLSLASVAVLLCGTAILPAAMAPVGDLLPIRGAEARALPARRVDVRAHDDAGSFALVLLNGRVASAEFDRGLHASSIVRRGTTVDVRGGNGGTLLRLTVLRSGSIRWESRHL